MGCSALQFHLNVMILNVLLALLCHMQYNRGKWGQYVLKVDPVGHVFFHREVAPWGQRSEAKLPLGDFSHVAAVYNGKMSQIFINGTLSHEQKEGPQDNNPETPVLIGAMQENGAPMEFFHGIIDEVGRSEEDELYLHLSICWGSVDRQCNFGIDLNHLLANNVHHRPSIIHCLQVRIWDTARTQDELQHFMHISLSVCPTMCLRISQEETHLSAYYDIRSAL
eukprot:scaffold100587_cov30-Prasinocladus_malaysianus.AAC.1